MTDKAGRPKSKQGSPVSFRNLAIYAELDARGDVRNATAIRDLQRYYALIRQANAASILSTGERIAVMDALADFVFTPETARYASHHLELVGADADLVRKVRAMPACEVWALLDAVERARRPDPASKPEPRLERVGRVRKT